ncbi:hypothetical protein ABTE85_21615, partial [Acinetobacter baumannii]
SLSPKARMMQLRVPRAETFVLVRFLTGTVGTLRRGGRQWGAGSTTGNLSYFLGRTPCPTDLSYFDSNQPASPTPIAAAPSAARAAP